MGANTGLFVNSVLIDRLYMACTHVTSVGIVKNLAVVHLPCAAYAFAPPIFFSRSKNKYEWLLLQCEDITCKPYKNVLARLQKPITLCSCSRLCYAPFLLLYFHKCSNLATHAAVFVRLVGTICMTTRISDAQTLAPHYYSAAATLGALKDHFSQTWAHFHKWNT